MSDHSRADDVKGSESDVTTPNSSRAYDVTTPKSRESDVKTPHSRAADVSGTQQQQRQPSAADSGKSAGGGEDTPVDAAAAAAAAATGGSLAVDVNVAEAEDREAAEDSGSAVSGPKLSPRVTIISPQEQLKQKQQGQQNKRPSSSRQRMERELTLLQEKEENERQQKKERKRKEVEKAVEEVRRERERKGVTLTEGVHDCRAAIKQQVKEEESLALAKEQRRLRNQTKAIQKHIQEKYGVTKGKERPDLIALAENFYKDNVPDKEGIPEHVKRELTRQEIDDLRMVFDMFDTRGRGYITSMDVRRAASMLGFKAKKEVFSGMIEEVTGDKSGRVTFPHFLQFVVKGQGEGDDPFESIMQCFRLLDRDRKGYITAQDIRLAAEEQKVALSNRAIREMIQEADISGDSNVTSDEFILLMLKSSMFRTSH